MFKRMPTGLSRAASINLLAIPSFLCVRSTERDVMCPWTSVDSSSLQQAVWQSSSSLGSFPMSMRKILWLEYLTSSLKRSQQFSRCNLLPNIAAAARKECGRNNTASSQTSVYWFQRTGAIWPAGNSWQQSPSTDSSLVSTEDCTAALPGDHSRLPAWCTPF